MHFFLGGRRLTALLKTTLLVAAIGVPKALAQNATYSALTTVTMSSMPIATYTYNKPMPINSTPASQPTHFVLHPDFEITDTTTTRTYDWTIAIQTGALDGYKRDIITINGERMMISSHVYCARC